MNYEINIGLEVHAELLTESKLFCGCSTRFGEAPNTQTCPVCLGLPGVLPVINKKAVEYALLTAITLNCKINSFCRFARKNYYYPDLPKNYQISQYEEPLAKDGYLEINLQGRAKKVGIERVHLEEDAGKLIHGEETKYPEDRETSFIDYNRVGIPLIEIVSKPDIHSPEEAYRYLVTLKRTLKYLEVSDCNMEEGSLRCDANISLALKGGKMGIRIELKNMNSFKELKDGLTAEVRRQSQILDSGEKVIQETRLWDSKRKKTLTMRSKEEAHDYRYFPEPDLLPLNIDEKWIESSKNKLPEMPKERSQRFIREYNLPEYDAGVLIDSKELADYFEECLKNFPHPKIVSNWIMGEFLYLLNKENISVKEAKVAPHQIAELLNQLKKGIISGKLAKQIFEEMFKTGRGAKEIIEEEGLIQISDEENLGKIVDEVIGENPKGLEDFKRGKKKALGFLVGETMKKTKGKANPRIVNKLLKEKIRGEE
ncbi:MAG: Asp-tRNA(Asn)/Glu-tRNA(Gln) amidotransferase subunit GatB [Candidatus Aerophobetes bacterium]|nr:Asp-tRNA(Asn)/Glu-tRNA(Gln) amidotransferase subunit GatB [Candidatus Aerophobetes bacterium]